MVFRIPHVSVLAAALISACIAIPPANAQGAGAQAGVAAAVRGDVTLIATAASQPGRVVGQNLGSGDQIFLGDNIETGPNSGMQIMLLDETIFTIGPDAGMVIDEFVYDPATSTGQVTASVVKGAFRFVSGQVAKETPQNMSVKTPVGTIGIRGTSAAGNVSPPDASGNQTGSFILLGPGVDNNANERAGRITVTNGNTTVEITRSGFGTTITGLNGIPIPPIRFAPAQVAALTGGLGTDGGARPASNGDGGPGGGTGGTGGNSSTGSIGGSGQTGGGGGPIGGGQVASLSGQNIGAGSSGASVIGQFSGTQNQADEQQSSVAQETQEVQEVQEDIQVALTQIATFDQLRSIQTGTAIFGATSVALNHEGGPNTNAGGSYDASLVVDFGNQTLNLQITNVSYFFNGGPNQTFSFDGKVGGNGTEESYANDTGFVEGSVDSFSSPDAFPTLPTDGATVNVFGSSGGFLFNDVSNGVIAANASIGVNVDNGTDILGSLVFIPVGTTVVGNGGNQ